MEDGGRGGEVTFEGFELHDGIEEVFQLKGKAIALVLCALFCAIKAYSERATNG